jgi:hypothetical protein
MIKEPTSTADPTATQASMVVVFELVRRVED